MDWDECMHKRFIKETETDKNLINSLIKSSENKLKSNERLKLDGATASTKISITYDSLREVLGALAIEKGFKIYNHECFCTFLEEVCNHKSFSLEFDKFRKIRNAVNYYGKDIPISEAATIIKDIIFLRKKIFDKYLQFQYK